MSRSRLFVFVLSVSAVGAFAVLAFADDDRPPPREPPPEAFAACNEKSEGDACTVVFHEDQHAGTCRAPRGKRLACVPNDMPHHPPPPDR